MHQSIRYTISAVLFAIVLISCSRNNTEGFDKLPKVKDAVLMDALDSMSVQNIESFYAKVSTKYSDTSRTVSFKTSIRLIGDSLINTLIKYANIPVMNALISPDSVLISNKRDKCYVNQSVGYIKEQFGVDFTHKNIEEFILGLPLGYDLEKKYYQVEESDGYVLSSHRKKDIKRNERQDKKEIITYFKLSPNLKELKQTVIESPADTTTIIVNYNTRELIDGVLLPKEVDLTIMTPRQEIKVGLVYKKTRINEVEEIHFVIPENYGVCE